MARGRMIDKVVILSKKVNAISEGAENLYYRILISADDFGRYYAEPEILKGQIYTLRKISLKEIARRIDELWKIGLIELYIKNGEKYLEISNFEKHQTFKSDRPKKTTYPEPKEYLKTQMEDNGIQMETNGSLTKLNLTKLNLREPQAHSENAILFEKAFEELWEIWPVKKDKGRSLQKFLVRCKEGKLEEIQLAVKGYSNFLKEKRLKEHFNQAVMYLSTFLEKNRWTEYLDEKYQPKL